MDKRYTNVAVLKETRDKIKPACLKLEEEIKNKTGHRVRVTLAILLEELTRRYMENTDELLANRSDAPVSRKQ